MIAFDDGKTATAYKQKRNCSKKKIQKVIKN